MPRAFRLCLKKLRADSDSALNFIKLSFALLPSNPTQIFLHFYRYICVRRHIFVRKASFWATAPAKRHSYKPFSAGKNKISGLSDSRFPAANAQIPEKSSRGRAWLFFQTNPRQPSLPNGTGRGFPGQTVCLSSRAENPVFGMPRRVPANTPMLFRHFFPLKPANTAHTAAPTPFFSSAKIFPLCARLLLSGLPARNKGFSAGLLHSRCNTCPHRKAALREKGFLSLRNHCRQRQTDFQKRHGNGLCRWEKCRFSTALLWMFETGHCLIFQNPNP
ncbi:hypothetical protein [Kingella potus]|uniref:hypothetical protein n=1 Tax=Kingella potus TaxID=265175 RepID=UPI003D2247FD